MRTKETRRIYYLAHREAILESNKRSRERHWNRMLENARIYKRKNPQKVLAHNTLNNAINYGKLARQPCSVCGIENAEGHHEDYSKPLEVIWLCTRHHAEKHLA